MRFKASLNTLPEMLKFVTDPLNDEKCSARTRYFIELAVEEVLVNIIQHAYESTKGDVDISYFISNNILELKIVDWGKAFNPASQLAFAKQNKAIEERKEGGLGIMFIYKLMDSVEYRRIGNTNNLILKKHLLDS